MEPIPFAESASLPAAPARVGGHLVFSILAGLAAALVGAVLWAALVSATNIKIGFAAVGVGFLVGWTMRGVGKGGDPVYGYCAAALSLLGCVVGDVLIGCVSEAQLLSQPVLDVIGHLTPQGVLTMLQTGFQPLDVLFYFLAISAGYRNAFIKE